jgi:hypothetical protein
MENKLIYIAQALRDAGLIVGLDLQGKEVTVSGSDFQVCVNEDRGSFYGTLYAGIYLNAHTYEEELFSYRNPMAVVSAVSRRVEQLNNLGD